MIDSLVDMPAHANPPREQKGMRFDGAKFKLERIRQGFTHERLALAISKHRPGCKRQSISAWERGQCPSAVYMRAICLVLGKQEDFFITRG